MTELYDINFNILLKSDIDSVLNLCQVNKQFNQICNDSYFWKKKFEHDTIPFTKIKEGILSYYFDLYKRNRSILQEASNIVNGIKLNIYPEQWGVGISFDSLEYNDLKFLTIDIALLEELYYAVEKSDPEFDLVPQIKFSYNKEGFKAKLEIYDLENYRRANSTITFFLTEDQLIMIIYHLIDKNVKIYDVHCHDVVNHNNIYNDDFFDDGEISDINTDNYDINDDNDNYDFTTLHYEDDNLNGVNEYYFGYED